MPESFAYIDFELEIAMGEGRAYPVKVLHSPAGEAHEMMHFPFDTGALENRLKDLQIALLRSGGRRRQALSAEQKAVQEFGAALFDALLAGEVRSLYDISQREAARQEKGLRLKLRIQPPELAMLPWEFLFDRRQADFLCISCGTPLVRYLELPHPVTPLAVEPPLRILALMASPTDLPPLDGERERQRLERALAGLRERGLVELHWLAGSTWRHLHAALRRGPWHIFHFIGHGGFSEKDDEGLVALAGEDGRAEMMLASRLARLLADHRSLRLAVLNACEGGRGGKKDIFSSTAAILVRRGLPAVLAMQYEITDEAAIELSRSFYEALADGYPVDAALAEARKAISIAVSNSVEWGTPVLYLRSPDGKLFEWQEGAAMRDLQARGEARQPGSVPPPGAVGGTPEKKAAAAAEVTLELSAAPNPVPVGDTVLWTVTVRNAGDVPAGGLEVLRGRNWLHSEEAFDLEPAARREFSFSEKYADPGDYRERVRLLGAGRPREAEKIVTVFQAPHFTLALHPQRATASTGETVSWEVTVTNDGGTPLQQIRLRRGSELLGEDFFDLERGAQRGLAFECNYGQEGEHVETILAAALTPEGGRLSQSAQAVVKVNTPTGPNWSSRLLKMALNPRQQDPASTQKAARRATLTDSAAQGEEPPMARFIASYKLGDDLFDDSFSIDSPSGEFLGECGVSISETIGAGDPKKVTAFEVCLFDKNDIHTVTKVMMSSHAFADKDIRQRLAVKGEPVDARPGQQVVLETATLQLVARMLEMTYGEGALPPQSFFDQVMIELAIWQK